MSKTSRQEYWTQDRMETLLADVQKVKPETTIETVRSAVEIFPFKGWHADPDSPTGLSVDVLVKGSRPALTRLLGKENVAKAKKGKGRDILRIK